MSLKFKAKLLMRKVRRNFRVVVTEYVKLPDEYDKSVFLKNPMIK